MNVNSPVIKGRFGNQNLTIPATPNLKRLGYGTGVGVYHIERSPQNGNYSSPWALKKLMRKPSDDQGMAKRLRTEAEILKTLNHPNIVGFRAYSHTSDGKEYIAMEECNMSLGSLIDEKCEVEDGFFSIANINTVAKQVAQALDYLHNTVRLLHGDIKSHNVLIKGHFDVIKLCDFGVSLPLKEDGTFNKDLADSSATYVGTVLWSAPEVYEEKTFPIIITDKADIFSYGLTIWEMLSLSPPHMKDLDESSFSDNTFDEDQFDDQLSELIGTRPPIPEFIAEKPTYNKIVDLFMKCTEIDYKVRFSVKQVLQFCEQL